MPQNNFTEKLSNAVPQLAYLPQALALVWHATRGWTVAWIAVLLIQGLLPTASVYLTKVLVDGVAEIIGVGFSWEALTPLMLPAVLMATVLVLTQTLSSITGWIQTAQSELVQDYVKSVIHRKASAMDLEFYETPEYYDHLNRANSEAGNRSLSLLQNMGGLLQNGVTLLGIAALLIPYGWWVPVALVTSTLPALWVVVHHKKLHHDWWERTTKDRRWAMYFDKVLTLRYTAPEVRLFGLADHFKDAYQGLRRRLRNSRLRLQRNQSLASLGAGVSALLVTGGVMAWMVWRAMQGAATLGDLALFYQAFNQGQQLMRSLLNSAGNLFADTLFLKHLFTFMELEPNLETPSTTHSMPKKLRDGIRFHDVSFQYPGEDEQWALRGLDLYIPAGQTAAVVGANGAGKSTLIKLLCRFYDPTEGTITLDGIDLRSFEIEELRRGITAMFQHPVRYIATARENIELGNLESNPSEADVIAAAKGGGAHAFIERLPDGYDTLLSKEFEEGTELSGGQWQRLTLARAFYREAPIVILDEPTSFMDSWAENEWLLRFRELTKDRTALIITHRFTTAMRADIIHVMDEGQIVESGSHEELLRQNGRYASSWFQQIKQPESSTADATPDLSSLGPNGY